MQPPASLKALSDPIYEVFYGLTEQPFAITTDPRFFYLSASHQRAFTELLNGLRRRESLLMLTGDTGTGKTTLCRAVLDALGDRTFSAIILNPYMTGAEVLRIVLRDFGLVSHDELRRGGLATADVAQLLDTLEGFLRALVPLGSHAVLVLDEAQSLTPAVLDQVRMLTGLEYQGQRLLQVVLCGQPGLQQTIKADGLLALNERITRRVELTALPPEDIPGYIQHRLGVAGGANSVRFDAAAMQTVADLSRGLPRRINVLCDRALQEGRIEGVNVITAELVKRAARALAGVHEPLTPPEPLRPPTPYVPPAAAPVTPPAPVAAAPTPAPVAPKPAVTEATTSSKPQEPERVETPAAAARPVQISPVPAPSPAPAPAPALASASAPTVRIETATDRPEAPKSAATSVVVPPVTKDEPAPESVNEFVSEEPTPPRLPRPVIAPAKPSVAEPAPVAAAATPAVPVPVATPAPAVQSSVDPSTGVVEGDLSFGLEKPRESHLIRNLTVAAAILLILGGVGYASWSWDVRDSARLVGPVPAGPKVDLRIPELPGVPPVEEMNAIFQPPRRIAPPPPVDVPELVDTPPEAAVPMAPDVMPTFPAF